MRSPEPFIAASVIATDDGLSLWRVEWQEQRAEGACPRCQHRMKFDWSVDYADMAPGDAKVWTRTVTCACDAAHPGAPEGKLGCGAYWPTRFYADGAGGHAAAVTDLKLAAAALALEVDGEDAKTHLRAAAEKWVTGVAAVLALFGIAGTVAGGKILGDVAGETRQAVIWLTVAAVVVAVVAVVLSYLAAYGWPRVVEMDDVKLLEWYNKRRDRIRTIAAQLRWAVVAAVASIGLLTAASVVGWLDSGVHVTLKVASEDDSIACGTLLSPKTPGTVRMRINDGSVREIVIKTLVKIESVSSC